MADPVTTDPGSYQSLDQLRERVDYNGESLFSDNQELRFDELLVRLERESRGIFETLWGDETPLTETDRTDTMRATDDAAMPLVYPIQSVSTVEVKRTLGSDWDTLDPDWYDVTDHRLVLARRSAASRVRYDNELARNTRRASWRDLAAKVRVTYDRGFGSEPPADIQSIQVAIVNRMLRHLRQEQTVAAASPEEFAGVAADFDAVVDEQIRARISDVTAPGLATFSV